MKLETRINTDIPTVFLVFVLPLPSTLVSVHDVCYISAHCYFMFSGICNKSAFIVSLYSTYNSVQLLFEKIILKFYLNLKGIILQILIE